VGNWSPSVETRTADNGVGAEPAVVAEFQRAKRDGRRDADGENFLRVAGDVDIDAELRAVGSSTRIHLRQVPVSQQILRRDQIGVQRGVFVASDEAAYFVKCDAELATMNRLAFDELAVAPLKFLRPVGAVEPVVEAAPQTICRVLRIAREAHRANFGALVTAQIAVGVLAEPEMRRFLQEEAALHERERAWHDQLVKEDGGFVGASVAVGIFEHDDAADRIAFTAAFEVAHVALILHHPDASVGIKLEEDRVMHHRLGGDQFDTVAGRKAEGLQFVGGREDRRGRDLETFEQGLAVFPISPTRERRRRARTRALGRDGLGEGERRTQTSRECAKKETSARAALRPARGGPCGRRVAE